MNIKSCPKCGARWIDGNLYWATGKRGRNEDLAGLVCDQYGNEECINEMKGQKHNGQTWESRSEMIMELDKQMKRQYDM